MKIAADFAKSLSAGAGGVAMVVGLYGDLGSGKTCFMQGVGVALGVKDVMVSPTFVIEKIYKLGEKNFSHLVHIDAYRLEKEAEMLNLGWRELIADPKNLVCIEWPEKIAGIMPPEHIKINFTFVDEHTRAIEFENYEI